MPRQARTLASRDWIAITHREWMEAREQLTKPWPIEVVRIDIRHLLSRQEQLGYKMPSCRKLAEYWGISRGKAYRAIRSVKQSAT